MPEHEKRGSEVIKLWRTGTPLDAAWFMFADDRRKELYRKSKPLRDGPNAIEFELRIDLQIRLATGELSAVGVENGAASAAGPMQIPAHFFEPKNSIDWETNAVAAFGKRFETVR